MHWLDIIDYTIVVSVLMAPAFIGLVIVAQQQRRERKEARRDR